MVTVAAAMKQLGIGKVKIYQLMRTGDLPYVSLPPHTLQSGRRIKQSEIDAFIDRNTHGGSAEAS